MNMNRESQDESSRTSARPLGGEGVVEHRLRAALRYQAEVVRPGTLPPLLPVDSSRRAGERWARKRWLVGGIAAAGVVSLGLAAATYSSHLSDGGSDESAQCPNVVRINGVDYVGSGERTRTPRPHEAVAGGVIPGCGDGNGRIAQRAVKLWSIAGIDPAVAVTSASGSVYERENIAPPDRPAALKKLQEPVACDFPGTTHATGTLQGFKVPGTNEGGVLEVPYSAVIELSSGPGLDFETYTSLTATVAFTAETRGATDPDTVMKGIDTGLPVELDLRCSREEQFVADSIELSQH